MIYLLLTLAMLSAQPDERDRPSLAPSIPVVPVSTQMLVAAVRVVTLPKPAPPQWIIPDTSFELPKPWSILKLSWQPVNEAVRYHVLSSTDAIHWNSSSNSVITTATVPVHLHCEVFMVISINADGLNSLGYCEP